MIGITFIGSGSKGNCALLELGGKYYLLDAGLSCRRVKEFLEERKLGFDDLSGIFITHEHEDHIKGLRVLLSRRSDLPVYCTRGTMCALGAKNVVIANHIEMIYGRSQELDNCSCLPFKVPHDATEPSGLRFSGSGKIMCLATDLGHVTPEVIDHMKDADLVCIESNYDEEMLRSCSYPAWLKRRIRSPMGHLPNEGVRGILSRMKKVPEVVVLMHVSQESNTPALVKESLEPFFNNSGAKFKTAHFSVAEQDVYGERLTIGSKLPHALRQALIFPDNKRETIEAAAR